MERGAVQYFFFSYTRKDSVDRYLRMFYDDLCTELSIRGGVRLENTGFFDITQQTGTDWPTNTGEAVGTSKVFVPVYSPSYFNSKICGSEWHGFDRRLERHLAQTGKRSASILPVWWVPPDHKPPATQNLHDTRDQFGTTYRDLGLRSLMTQRRHRDDYRAFVEGFALQVFEAGKTPPSPLYGIDLRAEPSAFEERVPTAEAKQVSGPKRVNFVVAAGSSSEMRDVRAALDTYGDAWDEWAPYLPKCTDPVVLKAQNVAVDQRLLSGPAPVEDDLITVLDEAEKHRELVVLIIDPWVVGIDRYRELLGQLDSKRYKNVAILMPGTKGEPRVMPNGVDTADLLHMCIGNWLGDPPQNAHQDLDTIEKFEEVLKHTLVEIRARIVKHYEVARRVEQGVAMSRPVLVGPEG